MPWMRSDTFSLIAIFISVVGAGTSIYQASLARKKQKTEQEASDPIFEPSFLNTSDDWPENWFRLSIGVRNRSDATIIVERIKIVKSINVGVAVLARGGSWTKISQPNGYGDVSAYIGEEVRPRGSTLSGISGTPLADDISRNVVELYVPIEERNSRLCFIVTVGRPNKTTESKDFPLEITPTESAWRRFPKPKRKE